MGEAPDIREQEDCPGVDACGGRCDQHEPAPEPREDVAVAVERSSLGTPGAKVLRKSVSDEQVAHVVARVRELDREAEVSEVLEAHEWVSGIVQRGCTCGGLGTLANRADYIPHVAEALAPLIAERERAAAVEALRGAAADLAITRLIDPNHLRDDIVEWLHVRADRGAER